MKISALASAVHHWIRPHVITRSKMEKLALADVISGKSGRNSVSSKTVGKLKEMFNMRSGIPYKSSSNLRYTPLELGASHRDVGCPETRIPLNFMRIELNQAFSTLKETDLGFEAKATLLSNLSMFEKQLDRAEMCWKDHLAANADRNDPKQVNAAQLAREWLGSSQVAALSAVAPSPRPQITAGGAEEDAVTLPTSALDDYLDKRLALHFEEALPESTKDTPAQIQALLQSARKLDREALAVFQR